MRLKSFLQRVSLAIEILQKGTITTKGRRETPSITAEEVAEAKTFFPLEKFFIFGHARSGTTVLARLVRLHPEVHCNYQAHFFTRPPLLESLVENEEIGAWLRRRSNRWNRGTDLSPVVLRAAADYILEREARQESKRIVGDKSPSSLMDGEAVHLMHKIYPDARLIYIIRDGRDTVISHRFQTFIEFPDQLSREDLKIRAEFSQNPDPFLNGERSIFTEKGIGSAAEGWVRNVLETQQMGDQLYGNLYHTLRYEDLLEHTLEEMKRLWDFLGAKPVGDAMREKLVEELARNPDSDWQQQKSKAIAQPLQRGKQGSWKEMFTNRDRLIFWQIAGETLKTWGYPEC